MLILFQKLALAFQISYYLLFLFAVFSHSVVEMMIKTNASC